MKGGAAVVKVVVVAAAGVGARAGMQGHQLGHGLGHGAEGQPGSSLGDGCIAHGDNNSNRQHRTATHGDSHHCTTGCDKLMAGVNGSGTVSHLSLARRWENEMR